MQQNNIKLMRYSKLDMLMCRDDRRGNRIPVNVTYVSKEGEVLKLENVVCTSVDHDNMSRRVRLLNTTDPVTKNAMTRSLRDCLILRVDDFKIVKS